MRGADAANESVTTTGGDRIEPTTIIWATGFHNDFSWITIPDALDGRQPTSSPTRAVSVARTAADRAACDGEREPWPET